MPKLVLLNKVEHADFYVLYSLLYGKLIGKFEPKITLYAQNNTYNGRQPRHWF